jgi:hypothetical protein
MAIAATNAEEATPRRLTTHGVEPMQDMCATLHRVTSRVYIG